MKRLFILFTVLTMMLSSLGAVRACEENQYTEKNYLSKTNLYQARNFQQRSFHFEDNKDKKEIIRQIMALEEKKLNLEFQYELADIMGESDNAEALQTKIDAITSQINELKDELKDIIAARYAAAQKMYNSQELKDLAQNKNLIKKKFADASTLEAGSVCVNNNLIKFDALPYVRGGKTMVPLRAISQELGLIPEYMSQDGSVKISDGTTEVVIYANGKITVDGESYGLAAKAEFACNRTFVPLRFLAETFGLEVTYNSTSGDIDIDDPGDGDPETDDLEV